MVKYGLDTDKVYINNSGFKFKVTELVSSLKVMVVFNSGYSSYFLAKQIRAGEIKDRLSPSVFGVGVMDVKHADKVIYKRWKSMLERCYCPKSLKIHPTYKGCTVSDEWLVYSNFERWMVNQDYKDKHLDKDIINPKNKIYSSENCALVSGAVNSLLLGRGNSRGKYPKGVSWRKDVNKFQSQVSDTAKTVHLGVYESEVEAHSAYCAYKSKLIRKIAATQESKVRKGLIKHAKKLERGIISNG